MDHPTGVDPLAYNSARCYQYTSSDEDENRPAPTTDDIVAGKRPMAVEPSPVETAPIGAVPGPVPSQGTSGSRAPKRCRLIRVVNDDDEEEEAAPTLVRRLRSRPYIAPGDGGQIAEDQPATHVEQA